jgi:hypothetical protein
MPSNKVFSRERRSGQKGKSAAEIDFVYLDRSARPEAIKVRRLVEAWFSRLPASERADWLGRFRSDNSGDHHGAFLELTLFNWLLREGFTVEHHPTVPGTSKRPDFLAAHRDGREFYLEARSSDGNSPDEARIERFTDQVQSTIGAIESSDFFVDLHFRSQPSTQPALGKLRDEVKAWLATLRYDDVAAEDDRFGITVSVGDGSIFLVPRAKHRREVTSVLGVMMRRGVQTVDTQSTIQKALLRKASRYGQLDKPYIIAVNDLSEFFHEDHAFDSVFGLETISVSGGGHHAFGRDGSGIFGSAAKPTNTRVSAALIMPGVTPFDFARRIPILVSHPWCQKPIHQALGRCGGYFVRDDKLTKAPHEPSLGDILGLHRGWPGPKEKA